MAASDLPTDTFSVGNSSTPATSGFSSDTKKRAAISAAALLLAGGGALAYMVSKTGTLSTPAPPLTGDTNTPDKTTPTVTLPARADLANDVNDSMSFANAFEVAREEVGLGGVFMWHNQAYNTFSKEEWTGLSLQQRQEYAEDVLDMSLPVAVHQPTSPTSQAGRFPPTQPGPTPADPTVIEGMIGDRRVMGIDQDNDGVIDVLVIEGEDGYSYRVADATGDDGLDTLYVYDDIKGDYVFAARLDQPVVLSNDDFSHNLEDAMAKEVVDTIMAEPTPDTLPPTFTPDSDPDEAEPEADSAEAESMLDETHEADGYGDTYVNNANVSDMDDPQ